MKKSQMREKSHRLKNIGKNQGESVVRSPMPIISPQNYCMKLISGGSLWIATQKRPTDEERMKINHQVNEMILEEMSKQVIKEKELVPDS